MTLFEITMSVLVSSILIMIIVAALVITTVAMTGGGMKNTYAPKPEHLKNPSLRPLDKISTNTKTSKKESACKKYLS